MGSVVAEEEVREQEVEYPEFGDAVVAALNLLSLDCGKDRVLDESENGVIEFACSLLVFAHFSVRIVPVERKNVASTRYRGQEINDS